MMKAKRMWMVVAAALSLGGGAFAQDQDQNGDGYREPAQEIVNQPEQFFRPDNLTLQVGGGVANFTEGGVQNLTDVGGEWTVRGVFGQDRLVGVEAAYVGSANALDIPTGDDATLVRTGLEALARIGLPLSFGRYGITPYGAAGLGWSLFSQLGADEASTGIRDNDNTYSIPLGLGAVGTFGGFSLDARFMYRPTFGEEIFDNANLTTRSTGLNSWGLTAALGRSF